ncbi:MAG: FecCD family ABC transporter permease [Parvibaculales bacterium]
MVFDKLHRLSLVLGLAGLLAVLAACLLGTTAYPPAVLVAAMFGGEDDVARQILFDIRLPRALAAWLVGATLGVSGAALQGLLRNPLADPGVLGVSAGAVLGATLVIFYSLAASSVLVMPAAAILGALTATLFIAAVARRSANMTVLILAGVGVSSFAGALMALMMNLAPNPFTLSDMVNWTLGSVAYRSMDDILLVLPFMAIGLVVLWRVRRGLSALTLGEESAHALGVNLRHLRFGVIAGTGLLTGAGVALAGAIGFLGIIAPHMIRPYVGYDPARSLLPSGLLAGLILVVSDIAVRMLPGVTELKLGVVAALIGAPVFVAIAVKGVTSKKGGGHG